MSAFKDLLKQVKAKFDSTIPAPPPDVPAPAAPAAPVGVATPFKLADGTEITVMIDDPSVSMVPDAGDAVTINGAPAPDGDYTLEDKSVLTVAAGVITAVTAAPPITTAVPPAVPAAPSMEQRVASIEATIAKLSTPSVPTGMSADPNAVSLTPEAVQAMYGKFATGTSDDRLANLEAMVKALMECNFGYQIRQGLENTAIQAYKDSVAMQVAALTASSQKLEAQAARIEKQDEVIKGLFELAEAMVKEPSVTPKTITGPEKEKFERAKKKEDHFKVIAESLKANSTTKKY